MNILQMSFLIRTLIVLAVIAVMVIAGALIARRRAATPEPGVRSDRQPGPAVVYPGRGVGDGLESNDSNLFAPRTQRRAA